VKIGSAIRPGRVTEKKDRTGQNSQKSHKVAPLWGEAPTVSIKTKICLVCILPDLITCAKFQVEIFMGYDFTGGSNFPFSH